MALLRRRQEVETGTLTVRTRLGGQLGTYEAGEVLDGLLAAVAQTKELHEVLEPRLASPQQEQLPEHKGKEELHE